MKTEFLVRVTIAIHRLLLGNVVSLVVQKH